MKTHSVYQSFRSVPIESVIGHLDRLLDAGLSGQSLHVALLLYRQSLATGGNSIRISAEAVATRLGVHRNTIQTAYRQLTEKSLIEREVAGMKRVAVTRLTFLDQSHEPDEPGTARSPDLKPAHPSAGQGRGGAPRPVATDGAKDASTPAEHHRAASIRVGQLQAQWPAAWVRVYGLMWAFGAQNLSAEDRATVEQMRSALPPADWDAVQLSLRRPDDRPARDAIASSRPAGAHMEPRNERERQIQQIIRTFIRKHGLDAEVGGELYWSVTRGELSRVTRCDPILLGFRLVREGRWSTPRSLPPDHSRACMMQVALH